MTPSTIARARPSAGRNWVHYAAFLPLLALLLAKILVFPALYYPGATLLILLISPVIQFAACHQMFAFMKGEIKTYQRWVWFANAAVSWILVFADPGGSIARLFD